MVRLRAGALARLVRVRAHGALARLVRLRPRHNHCAYTHMIMPSYFLLSGCEMLDMLLEHVRAMWSVVRRCVSVYASVYVCGWRC